MPIAEAVIQALEDAADNEHTILDPDDPSFEAIHSRAAAWVLNLFQNEPDRVPPTFAIKLFLDGEKAKRERQIQPQETGPEVSILDRIDALPPDHAAEVLKREINRLDQRRADLFSALERLTEET